MFFLQPLQSTQSMLPGRLVLSLFLSAFACDLFVETFLGSSGSAVNRGDFSDKTTVEM